MAKHNSVSLAIIYFSFIHPAFQNHPDMKIHVSCLGAISNFHIKSQIHFSPLGSYTVCSFRKGSELSNQGVNSLKQGISNFLLFLTRGAFLETRFCEYLLAYSLSKRPNLIPFLMA